MHATVRCICLLWAVGSLVTCHGGIWEANLDTAAQEVFIGWRGETYMPPPTPDSGAPAEPLLPDTTAVTAHAGSDSATVLQLQDIPAATAPTTLPADAPAPAQAPTIAADQHTIDLSLQPHSHAAAANPSTPWVQHLSWHPRLHLHHNLLTPEECDRMKQLLVRPSKTVGGAEVGQQQQLNQSGEDEVSALMLLLDIEQRVANWTALPPSHLEGWQLTRGVSHSEDSVLHTDLLTDRLATEDYQRYRSATVLLFLGDEPSNGSGGSMGSSSSSSSSSKNWSMVFPIARGGAWRGSAVPFEYKAIHEQGVEVESRLQNSQVGRRGEHDEVLKLHVDTHHSVGSSSSDGQGFCDGSVQAGLTLTGFPKGSALLIWNMLIDGQTPDASAAHLMCAGDQQAAQPWIATTWLQNMPVGQDNAMALASVCEDTNPACSIWAAQGFCDDAPGQMIGLRGMCRRSCQDCRSCNSLRPVRQQQQQPGAAGAAPAELPSLKAYMDCIYSNMHSLRKEWSETARSAGVRKARNAIRRDMRYQEAVGIAGGHASPSQQQSSWSNVW